MQVVKEIWIQIDSVKCYESFTGDVILEGFNQRREFALFVLGTSRASDFAEDVRFVSTSSLSCHSSFKNCLSRCVYLTFIASFKFNGKDTIHFMALGTAIAMSVIESRCEKAGFAQWVLLNWMALYPQPQTVVMLHLVTVQSIVSRRRDQVGGISHDIDA